MKFSVFSFNYEEREREIDDMLARKERKCDGALSIRMKPEPNGLKTGRLIRNAVL